MLVVSPPVVKIRLEKLLLDGTTPIAAYTALRRFYAGQSMLLESAPGAGELARYSVIGLGAIGELIVSPDVIEWSTPSATGRTEAGDVCGAVRTFMRACVPTDKVLQTVEPLYRSFIGAYGVAEFSFVRHLEPTARPLQDPANTDLHLQIPHHLVIFDHYTHSVTVVSFEHENQVRHQEVIECLSGARIAPLTTRERAIRFHSKLRPGEYQKLVDQAKAFIKAGEVYQLVLAQTWTAQLSEDPFDVYRRLRSINPSPYMFYLEHGTDVLFGSSPEMLCKLDGNHARVRPLAGTRPRPQTQDVEHIVASELRRDPKERAEHIMLVDLARNDLGRVCEYGSVKTTEMCSIERYSHVMHLVSEVEGTLRRECDGLDLLASTFPAGTLSGAPKIRAVQLLSELEGRSRGAYGGSVLRLGFDGSLDACLVLRSAEVHDGVATVTAGAGIVADSIAVREDEECYAKARAVMRAMQANDLEVTPCGS